MTTNDHGDSYQRSARRIAYFILLEINKSRRNRHQDRTRAIRDLEDIAREAKIPFSKFSEILPFDGVTVPRVPTINEWHSLACVLWDRPEPDLTQLVHRLNAISGESGDQSIESGAYRLSAPVDEAEAFQDPEICGYDASEDISIPNSKADRARWRTRRSRSRHDFAEAIDLFVHLKAKIEAIADPFARVALVDWLEHQIPAMGIEADHGLENVRETVDVDLVVDAWLWRAEDLGQGERTYPPDQAGITELRKAVAWANCQSEYLLKPLRGRDPTAIEILDLFKAARREGIETIESMIEHASGAVPPIFRDVFNDAD